MSERFLKYETTKKNNNISNEGVFICPTRELIFDMTPDEHKSSQTVVMGECRYDSPDKKSATFYTEEDASFLLDMSNDTSFEVEITRLSYGSYYTVIFGKDGAVYECDSNKTVKKMAKVVNDSYIDEKFKIWVVAGQDGRTDIHISSYSTLTNFKIYKIS